MKRQKSAKRLRTIDGNDVYHEAKLDVQCKHYVQQIQKLKLFREKCINPEYD